MSRPRRWTLLLIALQATLYAAIAALSTRFEFDAAPLQRPILWVIGLLTACFALHLIGLVLVLRIANPIAVAKLVIVPAVLFRVILLASPPIQEIDIYRYLWDGGTVAHGVNPYRYSPQQILVAASDEPLPHDLRRLVDLRDSSAGLRQALAHIHYAELTTPYPPVSQLVFAAASVCTPHSASLPVRVVVLKSFLLVFDLATLVLVMWLLTMAGRHLGWAILYGWSPLVLKEFANSGHLDAIAVCLSTAAVACWLNACGRDRPLSHVSMWSLTTGVLLGLAIGAKLYPIVLLPLFAAAVWRVAGRRGAVILSTATVLTAGLALMPMAAAELSQTAAARSAVTQASGDPPPADEEGAAPRANLLDDNGLIAFVTSWEMNDLAFMLVVENLRPANIEEPSTGSEAGPWFVIAPESWRSSFVDFLNGCGLSRRNGSFTAARGLTLLVHLIITIGLLRSAMHSVDAAEKLRCAFLTIAWFWALSPTMNPWYWTWAMPLLPFARSRGWIAVAACLPLYYVRFWLTYHFPSSEVMGTPYTGTEFFHFVVVPVEHSIWMLWLLFEVWIRPPLYSESQNGAHKRDRVSHSA